ncbi:hypothetical protein R1flu_000642 [Riccia fluitans]|uniref:Uncharacterized protein n=1 Tax=Riccia fluitans TaxID=41844 RepID=A0ABD1Y401_9MARC
MIKRADMAVLHATGWNRGNCEPRCTHSCHPHPGEHGHVAKVRRFTPDEAATWRNKQKRAKRQTMRKALGEDAMRTLNDAKGNSASSKKHEKTSN